MADWDADSPRLRANLAKLAASVAAAARAPAPPATALAQAWHRSMMAGLDVPDPAWVGRFRGPDLHVDVAVGPLPGVRWQDVRAQLDIFERTLHELVTTLDGVYPGGRGLDADGLDLVIGIAAWAHAEWVRIHPFANGNGRTARAWANLVLVRYRVPPVVTLRPRPGGAYGAAAASAMRGDRRPTEALFRELVRGELARSS